MLGLFSPRVGDFIGALAVGAALVSSFPEEKIPAAELTQVREARPGGEQRAAEFEVFCNEVFTIAGIGCLERRWIPQTLEILKAC